MEHQVPRVVYITTAEMVMMISEALSDDNYLDVRVAPGGKIWLEDVPANQWAFKRLVQLRGINLDFSH